MIIKEQRNKTCPKGYSTRVGGVVCEECKHFKFKITEHVNYNGTPNPKGSVVKADEWCELLAPKWGDIANESTIGGKQ